MLVRPKKPRRLILPNDWEPRYYQEDAWYALTEDHIRRMVVVWHRRAGKDDLALNAVAFLSQQVVGDYWYLLPTIAQAREVIWEAQTHGMNRIERAFPEAMRVNTRNDEMSIKFANGSRLKLGGSDNYSRLRGGNPVGIVFSEYAQSDPQAWVTLSPILAENKGWALFISTPFGFNHFYDLLQMARREPAWYTEVRSIYDTDVYDEETAAAQRREYIKSMDETYGSAFFAQEYECSFEAPTFGAVFADALTHMQAEGRILPDLKIDKDLPVHTAWDLGRTDSTAIWFIQRSKPHYHLVYYYESSGAPLHHYVDKLHELKKRFGWKYGDHHFPHDVKNHELISDFSRIDTLHKLGVDAVVTPNHNLLDGVNAVRRMLDCTKINSVTCDRGLDCLRKYRYEYKEKTKNWSMSPLHDWTSHGADALRTYAAGHDASAPLRRIDTFERDFFDAKGSKATSWAQ